MGEIIDLPKAKTSRVKPLTQKNRCQGRRQAYVLRHLSNPGTYFRTQIRPIGDQTNAFEQALRLHDQDDPRARDWYRKAIQTGECVADAWCNLGILESGSGWKHRAVHCFQQAIELEPRHFEARYHLGNLYFDAGDISLARIHYQIAGEIADDYTPLMYQQAIILLMEKQYGDALKILRRYLTLVDDESRERAQALIRRFLAAAAMDGT